MYPRIPWELFADPLRPAEHTLGTTAVRVHKTADVCGCSL
jgi:hypothetical protein